MASDKDICERITGLRRRKDGLLQGAPKLFTLIGVDISADKLKRLYRGTEHEARACELIDAAEQERRVKTPPTKAFVETCRGGIVTPVALADLWEDRGGQSWLLIMAGRKRRVSLDTLNAEPNAVPLDLLGFVQTFRKSEPRKHATIIRAAENCRNPRSPSERAEEAADMMSQSFAVPYIVALVEARDEDELRALVALHECVDEVKDAVDAGKILLRKAIWYATQPADVQRDQAARAMAGQSKAAKNGAAAPRPKTRRASHLEAVEREVRAQVTKSVPNDDPHALAVNTERRAFAEGLLYARGGAPPEWAKKWIESVEGAAR